MKKLIEALKYLLLWTLLIVAFVFGMLLIGEEAEPMGFWEFAAWKFGSLLALCVIYYVARWCHHHNLFPEAVEEEWRNGTEEA